LDTLSSSGIDLHPTASNLPLIVAICALVIARDGEAQGQPPCASPAFEKIRKLEGTWTVSWTNRVAPGQFEHPSATSRIQAGVPGCALVERFQSTVRGRSFWATALLSLSKTDSAHRVWLDSEHGEPLLFDGVWLGDTLRLEWHKNIGDRVMRLRHSYFAITPDSFHTATYLSPSAAAGWQLVAEAAYRRNTPAR
jgi:hypothetical protein